MRTERQIGRPASCACRPPVFRSRSCGKATISPRLSGNDGWRRRRMARVRAGAIYILPAAGILLAWLRIEGPPRDAGRAVLLALLAVTPVLAARLRNRLVLAAGAFLL